MKKILVLIISIILSVLLYNTTNSVVCDQMAMEKSGKIKTDITLVPSPKFLTVKRGIGCYGGLYIFLGGGTVNLQYFFLDEESYKKEITTDLIEKQKERWSSVSIPDKPGKWVRILVNRNDSSDIVYVYGENYSNSNIINFFYKYKLNYLIIFLFLASILLVIYKKIFNKNKKQ